MIICLCLLGEDFEVDEDAEDCDDDETDPTSALLKDEKDADQFDENKSTIEAKKDIPSAAGDLSHRSSAYDSVGADGNCGFRAVSFGVHKDQCKWMDVKGDMLKMYMRYKDTLYKAIGTDAVVQYEEERMINRLQSSKSPCLGQTDLSLWFSTFICPQIVADTYQRPVIIYTYSEHSVRTTGKLNAYHESQVYWPLIHMELTSADNPITLLLSFSHFYYVEFQHTPTGRMKKFNKPTLNFDHVRIREAFPQTCNSVDYSVLFKS
ncbi:hypothetical protein CLU79DRAFT_850075 [Phycomyces nitens]|nr:hypothetical protein CLU79DRAFT_850075 [Phycomyces nitens]